MGRFLNGVVAFLEGQMGPTEWRVEGCNDQTIFNGYYLVFDRQGHIRQRVQGRIVQRIDHPADVYIYDPPPFVKAHPHGRCIQLLSPGAKWFKLHFEKPAYDFPSAYNCVENLLTEAYRLT